MEDSSTDPLVKKPKPEEKTKKKKKEGAFGSVLRFPDKGDEYLQELVRMGLL